MEFIGCEATVAGDNPYAGIQGVIVDETRNTFVLETQAGERRVPKRGARFRIQLEDGPIEIDGAEIAHRSEDRIKKT